MITKLKNQKKGLEWFEYICVLIVIFQQPIQVGVWEYLPVSGSFNLCARAGLVLESGRRALRSGFRIHSKYYGK